MVKKSKEEKEEEEVKKKKNHFSEGLFAERGPCLVGQKKSISAPSTLRRLNRESGGKLVIKEWGACVFLPPKPLVSFIRTPSEVPVLML